MTGSAASADAVLAIIRQFIIRTHGELPEPVELDTPLLDSGMIDSFGLVELGMEISKEFQLPLLAGNLLPEDFETAQTLWDRIQKVRR